MAKTKRRPSQSSQQRRPAPSTQEKPQRKPIQTTTAAETTTQNKQPQEQRAPQRAETSRAAARAQTQAQTRSPRYKQRKSSRNPWLLVGIAVIAVAVVVGIFVLIGKLGGGGSSASSKPTESTVLQAINKVDPTVMNTVNTGGLKNPITATPGSPPKLTGPTGKPEFFYEGAEYCPYCAAQRWSVATALSRFGTFTKLPETTSSSTDVYPSTATLTFYGSAYSSNYIDFVSVEETTNQSDGNGGYVTLQTPTPDEAQIISKYNTSSSIPFISVANQYLEQGPAFVPDVLTGLTQQDIANKLSDPNSTVAKDILGGANYLTASICAVTNNQPASVCTSAAVQQIEQSLPKLQGAVQSSGTQLGAIAEPQAVITRRED